MTTKITALYTMDVFTNRHEKATDIITIDTISDISQERIEDIVKDAFFAWLSQQLAYSWKIEKVERTKE